MTIFVELYGRLRDAGVQNPVQLEVNANTTASEALDALRAALGSRASLLEGVALASETDVLSGSDTIPSAGRLAALPPVCGG